LVRYLVRRDADVDDLAQDALVAVLQSMRTYRREGSFRAWCDRIVIRVVFAHVRRRQGDAAEVTENTAVIEPPLGHEFLARRRLATLLDELPLEQRQALVLHHVLEMSVPEIASEFQISVETVRSRLRIGRMRLRERGLGVDEPPPRREP
jgi:RNA polymerase sigma-70 factor (ECF subfamily)